MGYAYTENPAAPQLVRDLLQEHRETNGTDSRTVSETVADPGEGSSRNVRRAPGVDHSVDAQLAVSLATAFALEDGYAE